MYLLSKGCRPPSVCLSSAWIQAWCLLYRWASNNHSPVASQRWAAHFCMQIFRALQLAFYCWIQIQAFALKQTQLLNHEIGLSDLWRQQCNRILCQGCAWEVIVQADKVQPAPQGFRGSHLGFPDFATRSSGRINKVNMVGFQLRFQILLCPTWRRVTPFAPVFSHLFAVNGMRDSSD